MNLEKLETRAAYCYVDENGLKYSEDDDGFIRFGDLSRNKLDRQCQYGSRYIDGSINGYPALGHGLRFNGLDSVSYHDIAIHPDDINEFLLRYESWTVYKTGFVEDPEGNMVFLSDADVEMLEQYLHSIKAFTPLT
jgi:hypothetical protein